MSVLLALVLAAGIVSPASYDERHILWHVNVERAALGLPAIARCNGLMPIAEWRAQAIRSAFAHNLAGVERRIPYRWSAVSEILAWTTFRDWSGWMAQAWMASPSHRAVIVDRWRCWGSGVVRAGGGTWAVVVFIR